MVKLPFEARATLSSAEKAAWMKARSLAHSDNMPDAWWAQLYDIERAPTTSEAAELARLGVDMPNPAILSDSEVHDALWSVIEALARERRVFLVSTDHLGDRELYTALLERFLPAEKRAIPVRRDAGWQLDLLGAGRPGDFETYLRHYASADERERWSREGVFVPAHEAPPHARDRRLPRFELPEDRPVMVSVPVEERQRDAGIYLNASLEIPADLPGSGAASPGHGRPA